MLPRELSSEQEASFGKTPYRWLERPARTNAGQWLIDPAWSLPRRYALPDSMSWSRDYCDNLFLGVDERGARPACPEADP